MLTTYLDGLLTFLSLVSILQVWSGPQPGLDCLTLTGSESLALYSTDYWSGGGKDSYWLDKVLINLPWAPLYLTITFISDQGVSVLEWHGFDHFLGLMALHANAIVAQPTP